MRAITYGITKRPRPPIVPKKTQRPAGPKEFRSAEEQRLTGGPDTAPGLPEARGQSGTKPERYVYWALLKLLGPERPGVWRFQDPIISGIFQLAAADFVVYQGMRRLVFRIVTERFHLGAGIRKQAADVRQKLQLERMGYTVIDLYEEKFINDPTGGAVMRVVRRALQGIEDSNPITSGTSVVRPARITP